MTPTPDKEVKPVRAFVIMDKNGIDVETCTTDRKMLFQRFHPMPLNQWIVEVEIRPVPPSSQAVEEEKPKSNVNLPAIDLYIAQQRVYQLMEQLSAKDDIINALHDKIHDLKVNYALLAAVPLDKEDEVERLRNALEKIAHPIYKQVSIGCVTKAQNDQEIARDALTPPQSEGK